MPKAVKRPGPESLERTIAAYRRLGELAPDTYTPARVKANIEAANRLAARKEWSP